jgi:hypothetical protein
MNSTWATDAWFRATMNAPEDTARQTANQMPARPTDRQAATTRPRSATAT